MTWLAWRQFRVQAYVVAGFLVVMAVAFALTGPHLVHLYDTTVATCATHNDCGSVQRSFLDQDRLLHKSDILVVLAPALMGIFWGAPLIARELESGTYRLAWTQSVTRTRWLATRFCLVGFVSMITAGLFSLMVTWWASPFDTLQDNPFGSFDERALVPIGYAAFAFALGVVAGVLIRRTLPAMAATLVAFSAARLVFTAWVRERLASPLHTSIPFQAPGSQLNPGQGLPSNPGDWIISSNTVNASGKVIGRFGGIGPNGEINFRGTSSGATYFEGVGKCPNTIPPPPAGSRGGDSSPPLAVQHAVQKCVNSFHLRSVVTYQPTSRYWMFQWYELTIFIVLALLLASFAWWWVRRRLS
jgi:hypothetical protein